MKLLLVQWQGKVHGSRHTLHETPSYSEYDKFWAIDRLDDPSCAKSLKISRERLPPLSAEQFEQLKLDGYIDDEALDTLLSEIWMRRTATKDRRSIKSKYIKIKHHRWGLIDEHRAVMQDHLGKKLQGNMVVHHKNGNKHDNRLDNLEVMSLSDHTIMHCKEADWHKRMYRNGLPRNARFTYVEAQAILDMFKRSGESMRKFAISLGLSPRIIEDLVGAKSYT